MGTILVYDETVILGVTPGFMESAAKEVLSQAKKQVKTIYR